MTCTTRTVRDLRAPDGIVVDTPSDDGMLLEMARLQHEIFDDPEPADDRTVARLRGSLSRGGRALIARDAETRRLVGAAQSGAPGGRGHRDGRRRGGAVASTPWARRGDGGDALAASLDAGLTTVFLEAAPGADGAYRNAGFRRTSTSVHLSLGGDADA